MDFKELKELIKVFDASSLNALSLEQENSKIKLKKGVCGTVVQATPAVLPSVTAPAAAPAPAPMPTPAESAPAKPKGESINSPMVGTFYRCPSPNTPAYVSVGDKVKKGQTLGIIEAMKIMNEIEAEFDCKIIEVLVDDAQAVEFGTPIFVVEKL